jgi:serine phosphatase RsbU (regulator of sigma subunit)
VGGIARSPRNRQLRIEVGDVVLLYTDGVRDHFRLSEYPQLLTHDAPTIARTVVERFGKPHDDSACLAIRYEP